MCLVAGYMFVYMPFGLMTLIYKNKAVIKKLSWKRKFGMLTEELNSRDILQLYFYPLFLYQRLVIAAIIVYMQTYPSLQCFAVMACNSAMIAYLIYVKPFKEENQQTTTVLDELCIFLCVSLFLILVYKDIGTDSKTSLGWAIIVLILLSVLKNFFVVIYFGVQKVQRQLRDMF